MAEGLHSAASVAWDKENMNATPAKRDSAGQGHDSVGLASLDVSTQTDLPASVTQPQLNVYESYNEVKAYAFTVVSGCHLN